MTADVNNKLVQDCCYILEDYKPSMFEENNCRLLVLIESLLTLLFRLKSKDSHI